MRNRSAVWFVLVCIGKAPSPLLPGRPAPFCVYADLAETCFARFVKLIR
jgi:hypothetical protein